MLDNVSGNLKGTAKAIAVLGGVISLVIGVLCILEEGVFGEIGVLILLSTIFCTWVLSLILFALGYIIDITKSIHNTVSQTAYRVEDTNETVHAILKKLEKLSQNENSKSSIKNND